MRTVLIFATICVFVAGLGSAQERARLEPAPSERPAATTVPASTARVTDDEGYKIGPEDVISDASAVEAGVAPAAAS